MSAPTTKPQSATSTIDALDDAVAVFVELTPRLQRVAYRILGDWTEAEDIVQIAWVRWQTCDRAAVHNSTAFLVAVTTRLAINAATSARARRESVVGDWFPEPVDATQDPAVGVERHDAIDTGIQHLADHLGPTERAAFVLRHAFDYPYAQIADTLDLSEANTRQMVSRAHKHLAAPRSRRTGSGDQERLTAAFRVAVERGVINPLERALVA